MSKSEKRLRRRLVYFVEQNKSLATTLESEVRRGVCIRQSAESKQARADIMRVTANQIEQLLKEKP